jgi:thiamine biosynthesis lipoprotein
MGMPIEIDVRDLGLPPEALDATFEWLRVVDARFSTYKDDSEIMRLNRKDIELSSTHPDVREVLQRCEALREETIGYFDIAAPYRDHADWVDPSGLVKGWSVDRAGAIIESFGGSNYYINAGGDIRIRGCPEPSSLGSDSETCWRIGIRHPFVHDKVAAVVEANDLAIATSGEYERGKHIVDPYSGEPPVGVLSVTIVGPDLGTADAYATAAFAMSEAGPHWSATLAGYEAMTVLADETVLFTANFPSVPL